jgi:hypothetical protein
LNSIHYKIAIRSYKRHELVVSRTLKILTENSIDKSRIYIFVANEEEYELYSKTCSHLVGSIIIGELGGWQQTKFIQDYFPEGTPLFFMDDDLIYFYEFENSPEKENFVKNSVNLEEYILDGFQTLLQLNILTAFTFKGMTNHFYVNGKPWKEFRTSVLHGGYWGCFNSKDFVVENYSHCDDSIRTARTIDKFGGMLTYNWIGFHNNYGTEIGGMQVTGERDDTLSKTYEILKNENSVRKFYKETPSYDKKATLYHLILKNRVSIQKMINCPSYIWKGYFDTTMSTNEKSAELF